MRGDGAAPADDGGRCPLTGSSDVELIQDIPAQLLIDRYRRDLGIDVAAAFEGADTLGLYESRATGLKFFFPAVTGAADMYAGLRRQGWYDPDNKYEFSIGAAATRPGDRLLDVGCGAGHFARHVPQADYVGHDADGRTDDGSGQGGVRLSGDLGALAADHAESFDVVTAFQVLEHTPDPLGFIRDCLALLKPGGTLVVGVPDSDSYLGSLRNFVLNAPPHHVTWWNARSLTRLARTAGLEETELHPAPVEWWEARLYWMARIQQRFGTDTEPLFESSRRGRIVTIAAYVLAGLAQRFLSPPADARGATTVLIGRKRT